MAIPHDDIAALVKSNPGQMTAEEYARVYEEIERTAPGRIMVFGAGRDTFLWLRANQDGETFVVDDSPKWLSVAQQAHDAGARGSMHAIHVKYATRLAQWRTHVGHEYTLMMPELADIGRPSIDVTLVDGPHGEGPHAAGRMASIYMASELTRPGGTVLVHDMHRRVEQFFGTRLLGVEKELVHHLGVWRV